MKIGDKIMRYCDARNFTMVAFSQLIDVDLRTVLNCIGKNTAPPFRTVSLMAEKMNVSIRYLLDDDCVDTQMDTFMNEAFRTGYSKYGRTFVRNLLNLVKNMDNDLPANDREDMFLALTDAFFTAWEENEQKSKINSTDRAAV